MDQEVPSGYVQFLTCHDVVMDKNTYEAEVSTWSDAFAIQFKMQINDRFFQEDGYFQVELSFSSDVEITSHDVCMFDRWLIANQIQAAVLYGTHYNSNPQTKVFLFGRRR